MKVIIQKDIQYECKARLDFIRNISMLWFTKTNDSGDFIEYTSIPADDLQIIYIVGHNKAVERYLLGLRIKGEIIVAVTCDVNIDITRLKGSLKGNQLYIAKQENHSAFLYRGEQYGFDFNPTKSEILLFNRVKNNSLIKSIRMSFKRVL